MQSKKFSLMESITNLIVGYTVSMLIQVFILPAWFGVELKFESNLLIVLLYTVTSISRSYPIRRFFNWLRK